MLAVGRRDGTVSLRDAAGKEFKSLNLHTGAITAVEFSPDGMMMVTDDDFKKLRFWEANTWKEFKPLADLSSGVNSFAFSPDDKILATGNEDNTVSLWDTTTWRKLKTLRGHTSPVKSIAFSNDSKLLATGSSDNTLRLWEANTGNEKWNHKMSDVEGAVTAVAFSPDGLELAVGYHKWVFLFDTGTQEERGVTYVGWANAVAFSIDGNTLAAGGGSVATRSAQIRSGDGSSHGSVTLIDLNPHKYEVTLADAGAPLAFSPNGSLLATGGHKAVRVLNTNTWQEASSLDQGYVGALAFSPNGKMLAGAVGRLDDNGYLVWSDWKISLWDTTRWVSLMKRKAHSSLVDSIAFSPDSRTLATGSEDRTVMLWDTANPTKQPVTLPVSITVKAVAFLPDGTLIVADQNGDVRLWDIASRRELAKKSVAGGSAMALSSDGQRLAVAAWDGITVWDTRTWREVSTPSLMSEESITCIAFSADGKTLATGNDVSARVKLWQTATGQQLMEMPLSFSSSHSLAFSSDGRMLAVATKDNPKESLSLTVWFAATQGQVKGELGK